MPWPQYQTKEGKYGTIYYVEKGLQVRRDQRGKWTIFFEKNGERWNRTIGSGLKNRDKALKTAEAFKQKLRSNAFSKKVPPEKEKQFERYSLKWLESNVQKWSPVTYQRYEGILRIHIWPNHHFKGKTLMDIDRPLLKSAFRTILKTRSPATVELVHTVINSVLEEAVDDGIINKNPAGGLMKKVLPPKSRRNLKEADPLDFEEKNRFLKQVEKICCPPEQLILKVMVHAGLRLGEALAIRMSNLDLEKRQYRVRESYRQYKFGRPKQSKNRSVDLPDFLVAELRTYIRAKKKNDLRIGLGQQDLLFLDPKEHWRWPYSQRKIQGLMKKVCRGAGLRERNPHDLRHTYATHLLMAHISPAYVQNQLGHSSIRMTVDIYGHWLPGMGRPNLDEALAGGAPNRISPHKQESGSPN